MINSSKPIEHKGIIEDVDGDNIKVTIEATSACSSCHAKGICGAADMKEKTIDIRQPNNIFTKGESVQVLMSQSNGFKALLMGYVMPFLIVIILLFVIGYFSRSEVLSGTISILALIPYYATLYFFREKIKEQMHFTLVKTE